MLTHLSPCHDRKASYVVLLTVNPPTAAQVPDCCLANLFLPVHELWQVVKEKGCSANSKAGPSMKLSEGLRRQQRESGCFSSQDCCHLPPACCGCSCSDLLPYPLTSLLSCMAPLNKTGSRRHAGSTANVFQAFLISLKGQCKEGAR